jgi:hypothetical protein
VTVSTREKLTENFGAMNPTVGNLENPWKNPAEKQKPKPSGLGSNHLKPNLLPCQPQTKTRPQPGLPTLNVIINTHRLRF